MFLNILRISVSIVLETFLNIIISTGWAVVISHSHKPTGSVITLHYVAATLTSKKETIVIKNV